MDWTAPIDIYCERLSASYWAEPVNAFTNLAFIVVALWLWPKSRGIEAVLCAILFAIGIGSWLFHTHATAWAALADTVPIGIFILTYVFAANRRYFGWSVAISMLGVVVFALWLAVGGAIFARLPGFDISASYWPVPAGILLYAALLRRRLPQVARGLAIGAAILTLSLVFRSLDHPLCSALPTGTHFAWHLFNAVMLGWMITVLRRDRVERVRQRG
ncbi:ceramidase domain-containing protein [Palleronia sp. LCG004]|uniref:ceramidase domain-containing protein n=1 Tax=Palleronia sp. LCG004 TaxID=3079304 RepID=UPI0029430F77|nr:ceramidase domain-containing protein [Palleronia sp. LCG004]WOI56875.1 ceramidase domain-containing protein [Palleronia sp. LCG004]